MSKQWQDNFRNRMEQHEESVPEGLWEGIHERMSDQTPVRAVPVISSPRKQRMWAISAVAAAAVILAVLFIVPFDSDEDMIMTTAELTEKTKQIGDTKETVIPNQTDKSGETGYSGQTIKTVESVEIVSDAKGKSDKSEVSNVKSHLSAEKAVEKSVEKSAEKAVEQPIPDQPADQLLAMSTTSIKNSPWQVNISMSNAPSGSSETYSGYGTFATTETVESQYKFMSSYTDQDVHTDVKHNQPVTVGLTLRYIISERWSVISGLNYSMLSSQLHSAANNYHYDDYQKLHYIGIPLNVAYTFWNNDKVASYISAGGQVEKNIAGSLKSNYYVDNNLESTTHESVTQKQLQWSVNSAIGIEYRISNMFRFYAEPGISYYFKNSGELETIYKDRPLSFNLRVGLRFSFND